MKNKTTKISWNHFRVWVKNKTDLLKCCSVFKIIFFNNISLHKKLTKNNLFIQKRLRFPISHVCNKISKKISNVQLLI